MTISYGDFELGTVNKIYTTRFREMSGAERNLTIFKSVGSRGVRVLNSIFESKMVEVQGEIIGDDNEDLITLVRNFVRELSEDGQPLTYENDEGEFVYDGTYVMNTAELITTRDYDSQRWAEFRILFLCPRGFARSTTQTSQTSSAITSVPYSGSITIGGDTSPEPVIEIELEDASTIDSLYFINTTTNTQIAIEGVTFADGDIVTIDIDNKEVRHNTTPINFDGVFPDFIPGLNQWQLSIAGGNNLVIDQSQYDDEVTLYGSNKIGSKFQLGAGASLSQLAFMVKKSETGVESLYDNFSGSLSKWNTSGGGPGEIFIDSGKFNLKSDPGESQVNGVQNANLSSAGDGVRFTVGVVQGGNNGNSNAGYVEFTDTTDYIRVRSSLSSANTMNSIISTAYYGSLNVSISGNGELQIKQVGADIEVRWNGTLVATIAGVTLKANSRLDYVVTAGSNAPNWMTLDNVYLISNANQNGDITMRIETNNAGAPSGTLADVPDSTFTIPSSLVGTSFSEIIRSFSTEPALSGSTVYHVVLSQSGGDINNYYAFKVKNSDVLANANLETYDGATWTQVTTKDLYFKMWTTSPASFIINLVIRYFKSYFNIV